MERSPEKESVFCFIWTENDVKNKQKNIDV